MGKEAILDFLIYNDRFYSIEKIDPSKGMERPSIYEVIRIIDGIPLYLEEHIKRLRRSEKLTDININMTDDKIIENIYKLMKKNKEYNLNIKILVNSNGDIYLYFMKSFYPPKDMYREGIHTIFYETERENPHAKTANKKLREIIAKKRERENAFEALLINDKDQITEGSRSNIFFVKKEKVFTPPAEKVLLGVTRRKIACLCKENNIELIEENILVKDLKEYAGAFITGTSIDVLPINTIDKLNLDSGKNDLIKKIMGIYEEDKKNYINKRK